MSILLLSPSTTTTNHTVMATALQGFRFTARSCKCRPAPHGFATKSIGRRRPFSLTSGRSKEQDNTDPDVRAALEKVESAEDAEYKELDAKLSNFAEKVKKWENSAKAYIHRSVRPGTVPPPPKKLQLPKTFMNMGERDGIDGYPDYTQEDEADIPTLAHGELEHHREMRHYARLAAWEMPLLSSMCSSDMNITPAYVCGDMILDIVADGCAALAKPFVPPTADMPLRFRYTTYMGEQHPAEKKVALEFCTEDIRDLTPMQREKLKKLVGVRYNPETDIVKMSCEMFETQAQNKRYLGDLVEELVKEAKVKPFAWFGGDHKLTNTGSY
jgi:small subunit ribosomal protein S35